MSVSVRATSDHVLLSGLDDHMLREMMPMLPNLRKLFMTALRAVTDSVLEKIAVHCPRLEQLGVFLSTVVSRTALQRSCTAKTLSEQL
jgi:hypothetical protein